jgi:hypothetical protein
MCHIWAEDDEMRFMCDLRRILDMDMAHVEED